MLIKARRNATSVWNLGVRYQDLFLVILTRAISAHLTLSETT